MFKIKKNESHSRCIYCKGFNAMRLDSESCANKARKIAKQQYENVLYHIKLNEKRKKEHGKVNVKID